MHLSWHFLGYPFCCRTSLRNSEKYPHSRNPKTGIYLLLLSKKPRGYTIVTLIRANCPRRNIAILTFFLHFPPFLASFFPGNTAPTKLSVLKNIDFQPVRRICAINKQLPSKKNIFFKSSCNFPPPCDT